MSILFSRARTGRLAAAGLMLTVGPAFAVDSALPYAAPAAALDAAATGSIAAALSEQFRAIGVARLRKGLDAVVAGDTAAARAIRDAMRPGTDRQVLTWAIVSFGRGVRSAEIEAARQALRSWPGLDRLDRAVEHALAWEKPEPVAVVRAFACREPQTVAGVAMLARAFVALDEDDAARRVLSPFWRTRKLEAKEESAILREFGSLLTSADHRFRMERMLYAERAKSAARVAELAGAPALAKAWAAVLRNDKSAAKLLAAVPETQRSAGYFFASAKLERRRKNFAAAAAAMAKAPSDPSALVDPDAWWVERRVLSRELLDGGDAKLAYQVAAQHAAESPVNAADAEFHAGWYALRSLNDPAASARHFAKIATIAEGPLTRSRAFYWLGRAAEAGAPGDAQGYFERAALFGSTFYGQLAAERLGRAAPAIDAPEPSAADRDQFARREPVKAIRRLEAAGHTRYAEQLYRSLAAQLTNPGELALLVAGAEQRGNHYLALKLAKAALARGVAVGALSHPVGVIPAGAQISTAGAALAYAVARQESEFNVAAVSHAGARGLLQLLPSTAKEVARRVGLPYSQARLTTDPAYNATLGSAFLSEQLGRFDGSYVLTFAGYNAGPGRAREWIKRYGDPRGKDIDTVVDWIERIPFTETRSYVQRVMENYQVYKMQLSGRHEIVSDLVKGR